MSKSVEEWVDQIVMILTSDGRQFIGVLVSYDLSTNVVLQHSHERVYSQTEGVKKVPKGALMIRGDSIMLVGKLDEDKDIELDFEAIRGDTMLGFTF